MRWLGAIQRRLIALLHRAKLERDLDDELAFHVAMKEAEHLRHGLAPAQAQKTAHREFGNVTLLKEQARAVWTFESLESWYQDIRYAVRTLARTRSFSLVTILTVALGISATTAIFSLVNAVLIRSLPIGNADGLAYVGVWNPRLASLQSQVADVGVGALPPSYADFRDVQRETRSFASLALFGQFSGNLATNDTPIRVYATRVTGEFFRTLDVSPVLGRPIDAEDERGERGRVAVISNRLWRTQFAGDASVLQRAITFNGRSFQIVGVMPLWFAYPGASDTGALGPGEVNTDLWIPMTPSPEEQREREFFDGDAAVGRLRQGVNVAEAQAEMNTLMARLDLLHAPDWRGWYPVVKGFRETATAKARPLVWLLFGAASLVLLIACSNAAHLLLARASSRAHEFGIRAALGAGRSRLIRQLLIESLLLACVGGALGVIGAYAAIRLIPLINPGTIPRLNETSVDGNVLLFSTAASLLTGILFGSLPAFVVSRGTAGELLKRGGRESTTGSQRVRRILIVMEVSVAVVLLSGATLLIRSYLNVQGADRGFSTSTLTMRVSLDSRYGRPQQRRAFFKTLLSDIRNLAGVQAAGAVSALPLSGSEAMSFFVIDGYANRPDQLVNARQVSSQYFDAIGMRLIDGRLLTDDDVDGRSRVIVVNEAFAGTYFQGQRAIGRRYRMRGLTQDEEWSTIVGVVSNVRHSKLEEVPPPEVYSAYWQVEPVSSLYIAVRTALPAVDMAGTIRKTVQRLDPVLAVADVRAMDDLVSRAGASRRFQTILLVGFAGIAVLLAAVGLYGLLAYMVKQRTAEIGIRLALGARRADIVQMVLGQGIALTASGITVGMAGAFGLTQILNSMLYGVSATDPLSFGAVLLVLSGVALMACWVPAIRACGVDPMSVFRTD